MMVESIATQCEATSLTTYEKFLLTEYNNIAQAHFNTKSAIATFFKHYLLIVSVPVSISMIVFGKEQFNLSHYYAKVIIGLIPIVFITISIVGFLVMLYIVNLDCDAILYARTVNGIRKYFVKISGLDLSQLKDILTLPIDVKKPAYGSFHSLSFVIVAFALINTLYLYIGLAVRRELIDFRYINLISFTIFMLHFIIVKYYIGYLEKKHLALPAEL
jgi:hypothetical protein